MKKRLIVLAALLAVVPVFTSACRGWPDMNRDVKQFRAILSVYRTETEPKPLLFVQLPDGTTRTATPEDQNLHAKQVREIGVKLDSIGESMEKLSQ